MWSFYFLVLFSSCWYLGADAASNSSTATSQLPALLTNTTTTTIITPMETTASKSLMTTSIDNAANSSNIAPTASTTQLLQVTEHMSSPDPSPVISMKTTVWTNPPTANATLTTTTIAPTTMMITPTVPSTPIPDMTSSNSTRTPSSTPTLSITPSALNVTTATTQNPLCPLLDPDVKNVKVFENKCLYFILHKSLNYHHAKDFCQHHGGSLLLIESQILQSYIENQLQGLKYPTPIWIGLYRKSGEPFYWLDGLSPTYTNFMFKNQYGYCIAMLSDSGKWVEQPAQTKNSFICEHELIEPTTRPPTSPPVSTITPTKAKDTCPVIDTEQKNMQEFEDKCLYFQLKEKKSFQQAATYCTERNGTLVLVKSKKIQSFIEYQVRETFKMTGLKAIWIGLHRQNEGSSFRWLDGAPLSYKNFLFFSYAMGTSVSIGSNNGKWFSQPDRTRNYFICQFMLASDNKQ